jgi:hypothetical protein
MWLSMTTDRVACSGPQMLETVKPDSRESFDETGYLLANPDVAAAIKTGRVKSGWKHFTDIGYTENRRQFRFVYSLAANVCGQ